MATLEQTLRRFGGRARRALDALLREPQPDFSAHRPQILQHLAAQGGYQQYLALSSALNQSTGGTPPKHVFEDLPINVLPNWSIQTIRSAVEAHNNGQFGQASLLVEAMLADDRVQAAANGRIKAVTKCDVTMTPSLAKGGKKKRAANDLEALWPEIFQEEYLDQALSWAIFSGFCLTELCWYNRDDYWLPRLKLWHPLYIWYDIRVRRYVVITMDAGLVYIEPNDPKWFLFTPFGEYRGWLRGAVRSCSIPWIVRQFALRDWARYSEVHGLPQKKVKYPAQAPSEAKASFFSRIKNLGAETAFALPQQAGTDAAQWDVELLEAKDRSWEAFEKLRDNCDKVITLAIRGTNLTTDVKGGSFAATKAHRDEDSDYAESDTRKFAGAARDQVLKWICLYNYGDAAITPTPVIEATPVEDKQRDAQTIQVLSQGVATLEQQHWPIDRVALAEDFAIPLLPNVDAGNARDDTTDTDTDTDAEPTLPEESDDALQKSSESDAAAE